MIAPPSPQLLWWVAYDSLIWEEHLHAVLTGQVPWGQKRAYPACQDCQPPRDDRALLLPRALYFAGRSRRWGGALPSLRCHEDAQQQTLARAWLLSQEQCLHIIHCENEEAERSLDLSRLLEQGYDDLRDEGRGRVLLLGEREGHAMITLTSPLDQRRPAKPGDAYLAALIAGLQECYGLNVPGLRAYLNPLPGIDSCLSHGMVKRLLEQTRNADSAAP